MNRAFLIIAVPAVLVAAAYIGVGWGYTVPRSVGVAAGVLAIVGVAVLIFHGKPRVNADK